MRVPHDNEALLSCKAPMTYEEILDSFTFAEELPEAALREASARRDELVDRFVTEVERWTADVDVDPDEPSPVFFLVHLLGSWREPRAYDLLCRVLRSDPDRLEAALGDASTTTIPRIIVMLFDGDLAPLLGVVEDDDADEFARSSMLEALVALVMLGKVGRAEAIAYAAEFRSRIAAAPGNAVWWGWAMLVADLKAHELRPLVEAAFADEMIGEEYMSWEEFIEDIEGDEAAPNVHAEPFDEDVVKELSGTFQWGEPEEAIPVEEPYVNPYRRVGRNDPCPCGSGKKFKRCHGA
jgi:hypothetical protein